MAHQITVLDRRRVVTRADLERQAPRFERGDD
jgi:hypothetical protein